MDLAGTAPRHYFLDWLRIAAFALLVLYHVGMVYVPWDYHVKARETYATLEPLMRLSNPWRMSLLFLLSGTATAWMLQRRPAGLLRERSSRLLLPLLVGVVLIVPPQSYFEVVHKFGYGGSYIDFLGLYFGAYGGFCRGKDCLILPTWNHLWFLPYLWCYTVLLLGLRRALPDRWQQAVGAAFGGWLAWQLWLLPLVVLVLLRLSLQPRFGSTHALVDDWFNHATYFFVFMLGVGLAQQPQLWPRLQSLRWPALVTALLCWAGIGLCLHLFVAHVAGSSEQSEAVRAGLRVAHAAQQWSAIVAALGFAHRHLNRDHPWRAPLTEAVFPVYLVHQTLIVLLAVALAPWALSAGAEALLLVAATFAGSLGFWRLARRSGRLGPWLGVPRGPAT